MSSRSPARPRHRPRTPQPGPPGPPAPSTPAALSVLACGLVRRLEARPAPPPGPVDQVGRLSETVITFACWYPCGSETAIAFAGEKWVFLVQFSGAKVMSVSRGPCWGRAVVLLVSTSPRCRASCAKKFAQRAQNAPKTAFSYEQGEYFRGNAAGGAVLGEFCRGPAVVGSHRASCVLPLVFWAPDGPAARSAGCCVYPRVFRAPEAPAAVCAGGRRPAREPSAPRASLGASSRSPARPRRRPRAPQPGPPDPPAPSTPAALGVQVRSVGRPRPRR